MKSTDNKHRLGIHHPRLRDILRILVIALAYFIAHQIAFIFPDSENILMTIWPAAGIGLAALLLSPRYLWPALLVAIFVSGNTANYFAGRPVINSLGFMTANVLESLGCAWLITKWCGIKISFTQIKEVLALICAATIVNAFSAIIGAGVAAITTQVPFWSFWKTWWIADGLGILLIAPLIVTWSTRTISLVNLRWNRVLEACLFFAVWCYSVRLLFLTNINDNNVTLQPYMLFGLIVWVAFRFGERGVTVALIALAAIGATSKAIITGPLIWGGDTIVFRLLHLQIYIGFLSITGFLLAASYTERKQSMEELQDSEKRYRQLFDASPDGIVVIRPDGCIESANIAQGRMYRYDSPTDLIGIPATQLVALSSRDYSAQIMRRRLNGEDVPSVEYELVRKDGTTFYGETLATTLRNADGTSIGYICVTRDTTQRKRAEDELKKSRNELREAQRLAHIGVWNWIAETDTVLWTEELYSIAGLDPSLPAPTYAEHSKIYAPESWDRLKESVELSIKIGGTYELELQLIRPDSNIRWVYAFGGVTYDKDGKVTGLHGTVQDITERKKAVDALRESEELLKLVTETIDEVFWMADVEIEKMFYCSQGFERVWGLSRESLYENPRSFIEAVHVNDRERVLASLTIEKTGQSFEQEYRIVRPDGNIRYIWDRGFPIRSENGQVTKYAGVAVDITDRKRAEEEKRKLEERLQRAEKMESLGLLAGGVAHDLNNVLGIIVGYTEMLLDNVDKESPLRNDLLTIMNGGQRAAAIVQDLLTLARRGVTGRKVLNLNKIILDYQKSPELQKLSSDHFNVQIKTDVESDLLNISASPVQLTKTIANLLTNALEAMPKGGTLTIKTTNLYLDKPVHGYDNISEGDYVVLCVSDSGEGIAESDLKRIFEPFYTKKIMGLSGTGLGLSVVWGIVKDHNGYIDVQSEEGKGTTFTLYLPVTREDITAEAAYVSISQYMGNGESILVVDDVKGQRELAAAILNKLNYNVTIAASGEDALEYLKKHKVDLLVLDMIMDPGMDGPDTYKKVLEIHPRQKAVIVSGFSESDQVKAAQTLGAGAYVKKPYIREKLGLAVKNELAGKNS